MTKFYPTKDETEEQEEWEMETPDGTNYKDITTSTKLPELSKESARIWLKRQNKTFAKKDKCLYQARCGFIFH